MDIVSGWDKDGQLLVIHCASGYNNTVITGLEMPRKCILICSDSHEPVKAFPRMSEQLYAQGLPGKALRILYSKPEEK